MIIKRQKIWRKASQGKYLQTSWWLFGIIPVYVNNKLVEEW